MFPVISRKRLILAGGILAVTAGTAGGTVLATRPTAASLPPASNAQAAATPQATPGTTRPKHQGHGGFAVVTGRVTAKPTESSISVADPSGAVTTYAVSPRVKVSTWNHSQESVTSIPVGELVVLAEGRHPRGTTAPATAASGTATPAPAPQGQPVVIAIRDTGFKAA